MTHRKYRYKIVGGVKYRWDGTYALKASATAALSGMRTMGWTKTHIIEVAGSKKFYETWGIPPRRI